MEFSEPPAQGGLFALQQAAGGLRQIQGDLGDILIQGRVLFPQVIQGLEVQAAQVVIRPAGALRCADGVAGDGVDLAQLGGESLQNQPVEGHLQRHPVPEVRGGGGLAVQIDGGVRRQGQAIDAFPVVSVIPAAGERGVQLRQQQDSILRAVYNPAGEIGGGLILRQGGDRAGAAAALRRLTGRGGCGIAAAGQSGIFAGRRAAGGKKRQAQDERQEILFHGTALLCLFSRREGAFGSAGRENIFFAFPGRGRCPLRGKE